MSRDERLAKFYNIDTHGDNPNHQHAWASSTRYDDLKEIGRGGMKVVYQAYDSHAERYVAYAKVRDDIDTKYRTTFIQEAKLTASLEHPNIMTIHDIGLEENGSPYFTMEFKTGDSLANIIKQLDVKNPDYEKKYNLDALLDIFIKICEAIAYAHDRNVIHLDLKPENIQVGHFGEVLVCDWGLSQAQDEELSENTIDLQKESISGLTTLYGDIKGTPGHMSPEQIQNPKRKSHLSDIYSLGTILYSLLCFKRPFGGDDVNQILEATLQGKLTIHTHYQHKAPTSLKAVVDHAMALHPAQRYSTVTELMQEIQNYRLGFATRAEQASTFKIINLLFNRHKTLFVVMLVNTLVILGGLIYFITQIQEREELALAAKLKAEHNLALAIQNDKKALTATKNFYQQQIINRQNFFNWTNYKKYVPSLEKSIQSLAELLEVYPEFIEVNGLLGYFSFIKQDFKASYEYLKKHPDIYEYMIPYLEEFKEKKEDSILLSKTNFIELLNKIEPFKNLHTKLLFYYLSKTKDVTLKLDLIQAYYKIMNPNWKEQVFEYQEKEKLLKISGKGFNSISKVISPLVFLNIKFLDLSKTEITNLDGLESLDLNTINLHGTHVSDIKELKKLNLNTLNRLFIHKGQFSESDLNSLPAGLKIRSSNYSPQKQD